MFPGNLLIAFKAPLVLEHKRMDASDYKQRGAGS